MYSPLVEHMGVDGQSDKWPRLQWTASGNALRHTTALTAVSLAKSCMNQCESCHICRLVILFYYRCIVRDVAHLATPLPTSASGRRLRGSLCPM